MILVPEYSNEENLRIPAAASAMFFDRAFRNRLENATEPVAPKSLRNFYVVTQFAGTYFAHPSMLAALPISIGSAARLRSGSLHKAELRQCRYAIVQADLFDDLSVFEAKHGRAGETHLSAGCRG